jgi:putative ABC transport system substrate-binding protein
MSYGTNVVLLSKRAAFYIDKILKGAKPADLPVEQPTTLELTINRKTADALGIKLSPSILVQATKVIE